MTLWVDTTASSHDEWSKQLVELLAQVLVFRKDAFDALQHVPALDLAEVPQPDEFKARTFWSSAVIEVRRQAKLAALINCMVERFPPRAHDFQRFLQIDVAMVPAESAADDWNSFEDPVEARFVGPGLSHPIFDRENLRSNLHLLRDEGFRTLNITGEPRTGKTFSLQLVQLLCEVGKAPIVAVDVEDWGTDEFTDVDLIQALATQLKVEVDVEAVRNVPDPHTRARLLLYAFRDTIQANDGGPRWIVIDGLDRPGVQPAAKAFVERLLKSIEKDNKPANTRLVVTGFDGILPSSSRRDTTAQVTTDDVERLLDIVIAGRQPAATDAQRAAWVAGAMAVYEQAGRDLGALADEVFRLCSEHFDGSGG